MIDVTSKQVFGIEFLCDRKLLGADKVVLRYDNRREEWTLPRDKIPTALNGIKMASSTWTDIWDMAQAIIKKPKQREETNNREKIKVHSKNLNLIWRGDLGEERVIKEYVTLVVQQAENARKSDMKTEKDWKILESKATGAFLPFGVPVSLLVHDTKAHGGGDSYMYAGLELRHSITLQN